MTLLPGGLQRLIAAIPTTHASVEEGALLVTRICDRANQNQSHLKLGEVMLIPVATRIKGVWSFRLKLKWDLPVPTKINRTSNWARPYQPDCLLVVYRVPVFPTHWLHRLVLTVCSYGTSVHVWPSNWTSCRQLG